MRSVKPRLLMLSASVALALAGCGGDSEAPSTPAAPTAAEAQALVERINSETRENQPEGTSAAWLAATYINDDSARVAAKASERSLQRHLAEEGSSYQQLLNDTRRQLAERYLQDGQLPATEIALLLGYSEPSVFFRAFRQWSGMTPGEYRQRHARQDS